MRIGHEYMIKPAVIALGFVCVTAFAQAPALAQETQEKKATEERVQEQTQERKATEERTQKRAQTRWETQAEKTFGLGRGLGPKLMTQEEWAEHHRKMRAMTAEERKKYRNEVHQQMMERAKERGITLPETPGPHGPGPGGGMGPGMGGGGRGR